VVDQVTEAMTRLHRVARPRHSEDAVHISATVAMFAMDDDPDATSNDEPAP